MKAQVKPYAFPSGTYVQGRLRWDVVSVWPGRSWLPRPPETRALSVFTPVRAFMYPERRRILNSRGRGVLVTESVDAGATSALLARVLSLLEAAGVSARLLEHGACGADKGADLEVRLGSACFPYDVKVRNRVTAESAMAFPPRQGARPLMVVPRVPAAVAEVWRGNDVHFVDGAGNAYLRQPGLLLDVRGRRDAPQVDGSGVPARWSRPAGLMVVFALLCEPGLVQAPYREIAAGSGASLGSVQGAMTELERDGFIVVRGGRRASLQRTRELLDRWVAAFTLELYPRLLLGRFDSTRPGWWRTADASLDHEYALWGGETAAHRLGLDLKPSRVLVYAPELPRALIVEHRLRKAADDGDVEFRRRFWAFSDPEGLVAPSPLVYADLIASGDPRLAAAARELRETDDVLRRLDRS